MSDTTSDVQKLILKSLSSCPLKDRGTFYFTFSHTDKDRHCWYVITFVDNDGNMSNSCKFELRPNDWLKQVVALDTSTLLIVPHRWEPYTLETKNHWKSATIADMSYAQCLKVIIDRLSGPDLSENPTLARIRNNTDHDFVIEYDGGEIPVHSVVLRSSWPFFDMLLESNMKEANEKRLRLPYPRTHVEPLISHLYGNPRKMTFVEATGVITTASVYDLPDLLAKALQRIKGEPHLAGNKALHVWKQASAVQNEPLMDFSKDLFLENMNSTRYSTSLNTCKLISVSTKFHVDMPVLVTNKSNPKWSSL
ncbi:hypothetical protein CKK34_5034 [Yarrowia sp. E02]|nr:hypothetical protein CKK34_5034 [Yarrowia sp. E02]